MTRLANMKKIFLILFLFNALGCANQGSNKQRVNADTVYSIKTDSDLKFRIEDVELGNDDILSFIYSNINNLDCENVVEYLSSLSVETSNNVEFIGFFNELLFSIIEKYPNCIEMYLFTLRENKKMILEQLENPISDTINLGKCLDIIKKAKIDNNVKEILVKSLQKAKDKIGE